MNSKTINYALIMAAGRGTRMLPLTEKIPKAMAPYKGSTLIAQGIKKIKKCVPNVYVTVGYKGALLAQHVIDIGISGLFDTSKQDNAWWIFNTLIKELDEPIFVLTCDNVTSLDFKGLASEYFSMGSPLAMVVPVKPIKGLDGDYIHHKNNIVSKLSRTEKTNVYCSGIQIINPKLINETIKPCNNFNTLWLDLIKSEKLICSNIYPEKWFAADTLDQLSMIPF